jgi:hypothetical protein
MSTKTVTQNLISSPLPAALAYFLVMFIGGCLAQEKYKAAAATHVISTVRAIPADETNINPATGKNKTTASYYDSLKSTRQKAEIKSGS